MIVTSKINNNSIYLPKEILKKLNLHHHDKVIIMVANGGMQIVKDTMLNQLDVAFEVLGNDLSEILLAKQHKSSRR